MPRAEKVNSFTIEQAVEKAIDYSGAIGSYALSEDSGMYTVLLVLNFDIDYGKDFAKDKAQREVSKIIEYLQYRNDLSLINFNCFAYTDDSYGNPLPPANVLLGEISKENILLINFKNYDYYDLEDVCDTYIEHPVIE